MDSCGCDKHTIGGDQAIAFLWCTGVESHSDDWLSIAESFDSAATARPYGRPPG